MGAPPIRAPLLRVVRPHADDMELQTSNQDFLAWDLTRAKHKWPTLQEAPFLWMTFLAWHAARRQGAIGMDLKWEAWAEEVVDVQAIKAVPADEDVVAPFPVALEGD